MFKELIKSINYIAVDRSIEVRNKKANVKMLKDLAKKYEKKGDKKTALMFTNEAESITDGKTDIKVFENKILKLVSNIAQDLKELEKMGCSSELLTEQLRKYVEKADPQDPEQDQQDQQDPKDPEDQELKIDLGDKTKQTTTSRKPVRILDRHGVELKECRSQIDACRWLVSNYDIVDDKGESISAGELATQLSTYLNHEKNPSALFFGFKLVRA